MHDANEQGGHRCLKNGVLTIGNGILTIFNG